MKILVPNRNLSISSASGTTATGSALEDKALSFQTYKSDALSASGSVTLSTSGDMAALYSGALTATGIEPETPTQKTPIWLGSGSSFSWSGASNSSLINLAQGTVYDFPSLPDAAFEPRSIQTRYHNNLSETGEWIGRSVVRQSAGVSMKPLQFLASNANQWDDVAAVLEAMRTAPVYVLVDTPNNTHEVYYGWTEGEPVVQYTGVLDYMSISFDLRMPY